MSSRRVGANVSKSVLTGVVMLLTSSLFSVGTYLTLTGMADHAEAIEDGLQPGFIANIASVPFMAPLLGLIAVVFFALALLRMLRT